ncbi:MAG TPA: DUF2178 domain-containing protein [Candidatus Pacearchaeota archaeon]|nr:DUF2178 domain-containing protein [Candidatus Pacearchaeota archaeon]
MSKIDYKTKLYIGFLIFIFNILLQFLSLNEFIYSILTGLAVFFIVLGIREKRLENEPKKDERTNKIAAYAGYLTFYITFLAIAVLWQLSYFFNINFDYQMFLITLFFSMLLTYFIASFYYKNKI